MSIKLKPLKEQVVVITGASSGIGLATAREAAKRGAKLVLASRNKSVLDRICGELTTAGAIAVAVECDVADPQAVQQVADRALREFGRIDSWINSAGVSVYGKSWEVPLEEKRRLFETNFWGVVYGCRSALKAMRESGGAIINIGSVLSERAIPLQGMYGASKHAVKAYTDSLRMELEAESIPVSVTLIKPAAINTPYTEHAVNHMQHHPAHTAPVYEPEVVANAILECCVHAKRDVFVGGSAKMFQLMETFMPRLTDLIMERMMMEDKQSNARLDEVGQHPGLFRTPRKGGEAHGVQSELHRVKKSSVATSAVLHPIATGLIVTGLGLAAAAGIGYFGTSKSPGRLGRKSGKTSYDDVVRH
ncbi:MAG: SDR family oxidoreductase [Bdellovibrionota bacterium]